MTTLDECSVLDIDKATSFHSHPTLTLIHVQLSIITTISALSVFKVQALAKSHHEKTDLTEPDNASWLIIILKCIKWLYLKTSTFIRTYGFMHFLLCRPTLMTFYICVGQDDGLFKQFWLYRNQTIISFQPFLVFHQA